MDLVTNLGLKCCQGVCTICKLSSLLTVPAWPPSQDHSLMAGGPVGRRVDLVILSPKWRTKSPWP